MDDLHSAISIWREAGESIIVMGDLNENIKSINMRQWRDSLRLREVILDKVWEDAAPCTYDRSSHPIDSIRCTANIDVRKASYLPFGDGAGDHRPLLIHIDEVSVFGQLQD